MVESTALEMRRTRKGTVGSNPTLSASDLLKFPSRPHRSPDTRAGGVQCEAVKWDQPGLVRSPKKT